MIWVLIVFVVWYVGCFFWAVRIIRGQRKPGLPAPQRRLLPSEIKELERQLLPPTQISDWVLRAELIEQQRWDDLQALRPVLHKATEMPAGAVSFISPPRGDYRGDELPTGISYVPQTWGDRLSDRKWERDEWVTGTPYQRQRPYRRVENITTNDIRNMSMQEYMRYRAWLTARGRIPR